jgi:hypothetical protein
MKLSKDELIQKINEKVMDEDVKIELMEDITDSFDVTSEEPKEDERVAELEEKYKNLQEKYKERFLKGSEDTEDDSEETEETEEKQEEVVDIKEI